MQFNSLLNKNGLVQDTLFLSNTTTASYPLEDIVRNLNQAYYTTSRLIWDCADGWHYDDLNNTDYPTAYVTLSSGVQRYAIPSTAQRIWRVEVKNEVGDWKKLQALDDVSLDDTSLREYLETAGMPVYYNLVGNQIEFYPAPSDSYVDLASGCAVFVDRNITEFTTAGTTACPGFAAPFHRILSLQAAIDFTTDANVLKKLYSEKNEMTDGLRKFYSNRELEEDSQITPQGKRFWRQYI